MKPFIFAFCLAVLPFVFAQTTVAAATDADAELFVGDVISVAPARLSLKTPDGEKTFIVTADTVITLDDRPVKLRHIRVADKARVSAIEKNGQLFAVRIEARGRLVSRSANSLAPVTPSSRSISAATAPAHGPKRSSRCHARSIKISSRRSAKSARVVIRKRVRP